MILQFTPKYIANHQTPGETLYTFHQRLKMCFCELTPPLPTTAGTGREDREE